MFKGVQQRLYAHVKEGFDGGRGSVHQILAILKVTKSLVEGMLGYSKEKYPNEMLILLRGKKMDESYVLYQAVFPPFVYSNWHSATYNPWHMPLDFSIIATAHSHPSGVKIPSREDLLHPYGKFMLITGYPYESERDIAAFDGKGRMVEWEAVEDDIAQ
jgi:proteasome lid subunit RPN8/RPN11